MDKSKGFFPLLVPSATVFFSSACIMTLELVAGRLIARHLGSSLYTWTSVIGVVLLGITIGNYLGGRIADRFNARKTLAILLGISSIACVVTVILNNLVGGWFLLWHLSWPIRVFSHVFLVFFIPSTLLGMISPVVAKMALDKGLPTGRTVGDIYAWGAAGSIAGTFLTGFFLIAAMGTVAIVWTVAAALLLMAILYWARLWALYLWAAIFIALMTMAMAPIDWAKQASSNLALREKKNPNIIYEDESQYCYIAVERIPDKVDKRVFMQDKLIHSSITMDNIFDLQYAYLKLYAAVTHLLSYGKDKLSVLTIGGGGYVFPRYIEKVWPGSRIDVAEIDPGVTKAAIQAFGLEKDTAIKTFTMDARNYIDQLLEQERAQMQKTQYDFVYEDALNDYSVPYQLTTKEFNDKIAQILTDDGAYLVELIDVYNSGLFLGAFIKTLEQTFPCVYVITKEHRRSTRNTYVIIAAKKEINLEKLSLEKSIEGLNLWILNDSEIKILKEKAHEIVITDDYAPVENMMVPVAHQRALDSLSWKYHQRAQALAQQGKIDESIAAWKDLTDINPKMSLNAYTEIAQMRLRQGRLNEAAEAFQNVIQYNEIDEDKIEVGGIHLVLALILKQLKQPEQSKEHLLIAIEELRSALAKDPNSSQTVLELGAALSEAGQYSEAAPYLQQAVDMEPFELKSHITLANVLLAQQKYDEAIAVLKKAIDIFSRIGNRTVVSELQEHIRSIENQRNNN
jgi:tetratricopeptide (TPR) repeat protein